jgi:ABC-type dipeptide/oligopeptide/nickel transport system permease component
MFKNSALHRGNWHKPLTWFDKILVTVGLGVVLAPIFWVAHILVELFPW